MSVTRPDFVQYLESQGGTVASSVTSKVTHLVCSDPNTAKARKAKEKGVIILTEGELRQLVEGPSKGSGSAAAPGGAAVKRGGGGTPSSPGTVPPTAGAPATAPATAPAAAPAAVPVVAPAALEGLVFCLTGAMSVTRRQMSQLLRQNGATVASSLTKKVTHLLCSDASTAKARAAVAKGVCVVSEQAVRDLICSGQRDPTTAAAAATVDASTEEAEAVAEAEAAAEVAATEPQPSVPAAIATPVVTQSKRQGRGRKRRTPSPTPSAPALRSRGRRSVRSAANANPNGDGDGDGDSDGDYEEEEEEEEEGTAPPPPPSRRPRKQRKWGGATTTAAAAAAVPAAVAAVEPAPDVYADSEEEGGGGAAAAVYTPFFYGQQGWEQGIGPQLAAVADACPPSLLAFASAADWAALLARVTQGGGVGSAGGRNDQQLLGNAVREYFPTQCCPPNYSTSQALVAALCWKLLHSGALAGLDEGPLRTALVHCPPSLVTGPALLRQLLYRSKQQQQQQQGGGVPSKCWPRGGHCSWDLTQEMFIARFCVSVSTQPGDTGGGGSSNAAAAAAAAVAATVVSSLHKVAMPTRAYLTFSLLRHGLLPSPPATGGSGGGAGDGGATLRTLMRDATRRSVGQLSRAREFWSAQAVAAAAAAIFTPDSTHSSSQLVITSAGFCDQLLQLLPAPMEPLVLSWLSTTASVADAVSRLAKGHAQTAVTEYLQRAAAEAATSPHSKMLSPVESVDENQYRHCRWPLAMHLCAYLSHLRASRQSLPAEYFPLVETLFRLWPESLKQAHHQTAAPIVTLLRRGLRAAVPTAVLEPLLLPFVASCPVGLLACCPSEAVIDAALQALLGATKGGQVMYYGFTAHNELHKFGAAIVPPMDALLRSKATPAQAKHVLVRNLYNTLKSSSAATVAAAAAALVPSLEMGKGLSTPTVAALVGAGDTAVPALIEGVFASKKAIRLNCVQALAAMTTTPALVAAAAAALASGRKIKEAESQDKLLALSKRRPSATATAAAAGDTSSVPAELTEEKKAEIIKTLHESEGAGWEQYLSSVPATALLPLYMEYATAAAEAASAGQWNQGIAAMLWRWQRDKGGSNPLSHYIALATALLDVDELYATEHLFCHGMFKPQRSGGAVSWYNHRYQQSTFAAASWAPLFLQPAARLLAEGITQQNSHILGFLLANLPEGGGGEDPSPALIATTAQAFTHDNPGVRAAGKALIARLGDSASEAILPALKSSQITRRLAVAKQLIAAPVATATAGLRAALARERSKRALPFLQAALCACEAASTLFPGVAAAGGGDDGDDGDGSGDGGDHLALDAVLTGLTAPQHCIAVPATLQWRSGLPVSPAAANWLLSQLVFETSEGQPCASWSLRPQLCPASLAACAKDVIKPLQGKKYGWLPYLQTYLASEAEVEALAEPLDRMSRGGKHTVAFAFAAAFGRRPGSQQAIYWLDYWTRKARSSGLRKHTRAALATLSAVCGVPRAELVDRVVPTTVFSVDKGSASFELGSRTLTLTLDADASGAFKAYHGNKLLRTIPSKPVGKGVCAATYAEQRTQLLSLRRSTRAAFAAQRERLELAMSDERGWAPSLWRRLFQHHPVFHALARRLLFSQRRRRGGAGQLLFRLSDDGRALVDAKGRAVSLDDGGGPVRIAHPLRLSDSALKRWADILGDSQPFPQTRRPFHRLSPDDQSTTISLSAPSAPALPLHGALKRGQWDMAYEDAGVVSSARKALPGTPYAVLITHSGYSPLDLAGGRWRGGGGGGGGSRVVEIYSVQLLRRPRRRRQVGSVSDTPPAAGDEDNTSGGAGGALPWSRAPVVCSELRCALERITGSSASSGSGSGDDEE